MTSGRPGRRGLRHDPITRPSDAATAPVRSSAPSRRPVGLGTVPRAGARCGAASRSPGRRRHLPASDAGARRPGRRAGRLLPDHDRRRDRRVGSRWDLPGQDHWPRRWRSLVVGRRHWRTRGRGSPGRGDVRRAARSVLQRKRGRRRSEPGRRRRRRRRGRHRRDEPPRWRRWWSNRGVGRRCHGARGRRRWRRRGRPSELAERRRWRRRHCGGGRRPRPGHQWHERRRHGWCHRRRRPGRPGAGRRQRRRELQLGCTQRGGRWRGSHGGRRERRTRPELRLRWWRWCRVHRCWRRIGDDRRQRDRRWRRRWIELGGGDLADRRSAGSLWHHGLGGDDHRHRYRGRGERPARHRLAAMPVRPRPHEDGQPLAGQGRRQDHLDGGGHQQRP